MPPEQSQINWTTIFISALSALIALLVKAAIELYQKNTEFKHELTKSTYMRKLDLAEQAISYYWAYFAKLTEVIKTIEFSIKNLPDIDTNKLSFDSSQAVLTVLNRQLQEFTEKEFYKIHGLNLYLDLDGKTVLPNQNLEELIEAASTADYYTRTMANSSEKYLNSNNEQEEAYWLSKIKEDMPNQIEALRKIKTSLEEYQNYTKTVIQEIKSQITTYQ